MNKRFLFPVTVLAMFSLAAGSAFAGTGVDFQAAGHTSKRQLVIEPGTDPASVQFHFAGAQRISFSPTGTLQIMKADGSMWHYKPDVYQVVNGKRRNVPATFSFIGKDRVSLHVSKFDNSAPLIVTPVDGPASHM